MTKKMRRHVLPVVVASCLTDSSSIYGALHLPLGTSVAAAPTAKTTTSSSMIRRRHLQQPQKFPMDTLKFGFNTNIDVSDNPPFMDYKTVLCQIDYFYTDFLQEYRPQDTYTDVVLQVVDWSFNSSNSELPISISYIANATDETGDYHNPDVINAKLASRGFFLKKMVQGAWGGDNRFRGVTTIQQEATTWTLPQIQEAGDYKFTTAKCPERGTFLANVSYGFFDTKASKPTPLEVDDLETLTNVFMESVFQEELKRDDVTVQFKVRDWIYTPEEETFPLNITFSIQGFLDDGGKEEIPLDVLKYHLTKRTSDPNFMTTYIKEAVWDTPPLKEGAFYNVNKALMETKVHTMTDQELQESDLFLDALGDDGSGEEEPVDVTDLTPAPTPPPVGGEGVTAGGGGIPEEGGPTRANGFEIPGFGGNNNDEEADDEGEQPSRAGGFEIPSFNIGGMTFPGIGGDGAGAGADSNPGSSGGSPSGGGPSSNPLGDRPDPSASTTIGLPSLISGGVLRPDQATEPECASVMTNVDTNNDKLLSKTEFIALINGLTRDSYAGYVFDALPVRLQQGFLSLASEEIDGMGVLIPISKGSDDPLNQIVEDAIRSNIICRALKRAINEIVEEDPIRGPAVNQPAVVKFMTSCEGDECGESGKMILEGAFRNFLKSDIKPLFEASQKEHDAFMSTENATIADLGEMDCPRHEDDPGDDSVQCYEVTAEFEVFCKGEDQAHAQEVTEAAQTRTLQAIDAGLLKESIKLMSLLGVPLPWVVYPNMDAVLSMQPSSSPTNVPSSSPSMSPSVTQSQLNKSLTSGTIGVSSPVPNTKSPTLAPSQTPSSEPSLAPTSTPNKSFMDKLADMEGATVGWAAAAGILMMIILQFFRELLVDIVIKMGMFIVNVGRWLFGYDWSGPEEDESEFDEDSSQESSLDEEEEESSEDEENGKKENEDTGEESSVEEEEESSVEEEEESSEDEEDSKTESEDSSQESSVDDDEEESREDEEDGKRENR